MLFSLLLLLSSLIPLFSALPGDTSAVTQHSPSHSDVSVALVSMVMNEGDILRQWLDYHSEIFGLSNIIVLDNFSTCNTTVGILKDYEKRGLHVVYEQGPYIDMGDLSYKAVKQILPEHKLALPLDVDEFLVAYTHGSPQANRSLIWKHLNYMWGTGGPCYGFKQYYSSYPVGANASLDTIRYFTRNIYQVRVTKKIYWLQQVSQSVFGGHVNARGGAHEHENDRLKCRNAQDRLGLLHYHLRSPLGTAQRALRDCIALKYLPEHATLETIHDFTRLLRLLVLQHKLHEQANLVAFHKIEELLSYAEHGEEAFVYSRIDHLEKVGTLKEIIDTVKAT